MILLVIGTHLQNTETLHFIILSDCMKQVTGTQMKIRVDMHKKIKDDSQCALERIFIPAEVKFP